MQLCSGKSYCFMNKCNNCNVIAGGNSRGDADGKAMELIPHLPNEIARECLIRVSPENLAAVVKVSKDWKKEVESSEFYLQRKAGGFTQHITVLIQEEDHMWPMSNLAYYWITFYEADTGIWRKVPLPPEVYKIFPYNWGGCTGVGRNLVLIVWCPGAPNSVFIYDFVSATWRRGTDMPGESRSLFACSSDSDKMVFVAGGKLVGLSGSNLKSAMTYNVAKDEWIPLPDLARGRSYCKGIFYHGKFHVISGDSVTFDRSSEVFDIATWRWDLVDNFLEDTGHSRGWLPFGNQRKMFRRNLGNIVVLEDDGVSWKAVAEVPEEVYMVLYMVSWQENVLVIGYSHFKESRVSRIAYILETEGYTWSKIDLPQEFSTCIFDGFCLEV